MQWINDGQTTPLAPVHCPNRRSGAQICLQLDITRGEISITRRLGVAQFRPRWSPFLGLPWTEDLDDINLDEPIYHIGFEA